MSGSPKYSHAHLSAAVLRQLLEARQLQAAAEQARREAEAQRRQRERLTQSRDDAGRDMAAARQELTALAGDRAGRALPAGRLDALRQRLRRLEDEPGRVRDEQQARRVGAEARALRDQLRQARAEGEAASLAEGLAREEAAAAELRQRFAALDTARGERFDAAGRVEVTALLQEVDRLLRRKSLAEAADTAARARARLDRHQADVAERFARWAEERDRALDALAQAGDRVAGLRSDPVVTRWCAAEVAALEARLPQAEGLLGRDDFQAAGAEAERLSADCAGTVTRAGEWQFKEDQRQYVVRGIVESMRQLGLVVQAGYPQPEHAGVPSSATIIQAQRLGGGAIAVSVPQEGEVWYDVDGFPMRVESGADGGFARTCDEAEEQINRVHAALREAFEIEMDELDWEGRDPNRVLKTAKALPGSAGARTQKGQ
jgi:hypothetical protein